MSIDATTSSVSASASTQTTNNAQSTSKTSPSDSSFKDEMSKVSKSESQKDAKTSEKESNNLKNDSKTDKNIDKLSTEKEDKVSLQNDSSSNLQPINALNGPFSINDANTMLTTDIAQMIENTVTVNEANLKNWTFGFGDSGAKSSLKMNESDADFFINLTQNENVNIQSIHAQAQGMLNTGADVAEVKQHVQVSQALLDALSNARENNQPLRIDFDQNISVILRVGRDGAVSAHFIPGDKAVEQYLRNNIESLKSAFDEQSLNYNELSYSTASKEQNQRRREEKRQGE